jgi:hypothetical protein
MDKTFEKIKAIRQSDLEEYNKFCMLGSGQHASALTGAAECGCSTWKVRAILTALPRGGRFSGHANKEIRQAVYEQMGELGHLSQNSDSLPRYALAKKLADLAPAHLNRVLFTVGGSAAIEAAMKIAVKNVAGARKFICLQDCYHGTSLTTGAASWISTKAAGIFTGFNSFSGIVNDIFVRVPNPYLYRWTDTPDPEDCIDYCLRVARETLRAGVCGPAAGFIVEPLQANGGRIQCLNVTCRTPQICDDRMSLIFDGADLLQNRRLFRTNQLMWADSSARQVLGGGIPIAAILIHDRLEGSALWGRHSTSDNGIAQVEPLKQLRYN